VDRNSRILWKASFPFSRWTISACWRTNIGGVEKTFDTKITEQIPDKRIAWRSLSGAPNAGVVTFHSLSAGTSRIMLQMEYEPEGLLENAGDLLGVASHRVKADLEGFKEFIESRGAETGAWRGKVEPPGISHSRGAAVRNTDIDKKGRIKCLK